MAATKGVLGQLLSCAAQSLPAAVVGNPLLAGVVGVVGVVSAAIGGAMWFGVRLPGRPERGAAPLNSPAWTAYQGGARADHGS